MAGLCGYQAFQTDAYTRALDTDGETVVGTVTAQTLRPCMLGDFCYRRRRPDLTHVGYATITYTDRRGMRHQGQHAINNETAGRHQRGQRVRVTYPRGDSVNATFGDPDFNRRGRLIAKILYSLGLLVLIGSAFWIHSLPDHEFTD